MKKILLIVSLIIWVNSSAQNEAANWYFGQNAGIQFDDTGTLLGGIDGGQLNTLEGCTTISDTDGNLLFYTDGRLVYNRNHQLMPNGTDLFGDSSSTQSALVVPQPGSDTIYFIFTVDTSVPGSLADHGFNYSIVDMTLDGGLGDITSKNINLLEDTSEKITAVLKDCATESIWVIVLANFDGTPSLPTVPQVFNTYHAYEVSTTGINPTAVKSTFTQNIGDQRGQMKVSPDGKKLVSANMGSGLFLYDFDADTGIVSNPISLSITAFPPLFAYGVEFSQNSLRLYVNTHNNGPAQIGTLPSAHRSSLVQFDISATNIQASEFLIDEQQLYRGSLQLGPDGRIYRALSATYDDDPNLDNDGGLPFLGVIENPNDLGPSVVYTHNAVSLAPNVSTQGLPPFIQSFFNDQIDIIQNGVSSTELSLCDGETYTLAYENIVGAVYTWMKDGVLLAEDDFDLEVSEAGTYTLHIEFNNGACETFDGEAIVTYFEVPVANEPDDISICDDDNDATWSFDFTTQDNLVLGTQDPTVFEVKYFTSQADADNNENEIVGIYNNITTPQEIFVRIQNRGFDGCFDTTSFIVEVFDTPLANVIGFAPNIPPPLPINEFCDDDSDGDQQNGQVTTDLTIFDSEALGGQDPTLFDVSYHHSQSDADSRSNPIASPYYNLTPYSEGIFVRVENNQNTDCYSTSFFSLIVHDLPIANPVNDVAICDDDNDGLFSFDFNNLYDSTVLGTQNPATFNVQYYASSDDALNDENALIMPYQTVSNPQTIYVRVSNNDSAICSDTTSFNIEVFNTPTANEVADVEVCDNSNDGNDTNGQVITELSDFDSVVLGTQDPASYSITYHASQLDADSGANALPTTFYNTTPNTQEVFIRIENNLNTDCYDTTSFNIIVNPLPVVFDALLFQCDYDGNPDGFTLFNLTEAHDQITASAPDLSTHFYLSLTDAQNDTNEIDGSSFSNTVNPQIINVRIVNDITGCYRLAELTLDVSATNVNDAELFACDSDGVEDGFFEFNLSDADATVLGGSPAGITLSYYETSEDALLETNPLPINFTNTVPYFQTIYVRAENDNACYGINEVDLTVYQLPQIETEDETIYCLNTYPETITINAGLVVGNPNDYQYQWSTGEDTYEIEINAAGTYSVAVTNSNGCSKDRTIAVLPSNIATIDDIEVVDATSNNSITILVSGEGDYKYALNNVNGPYQESNIFENVPPGLHTVYIRDKNNCGIVEDIVSVIGFPKFLTPNGDGYHDTWQVYGLNHSSQIESIVYIFDRFGKLIKQLSPTGPGWDGTFNGEKLPSSDYWFHVKLQDGRVFKSHFTLKR